MQAEIIIRQGLKDARTVGNLRHLALIGTVFHGSGMVAWLC